MKISGGHMILFSRKQLLEQGYTDYAIKKAIENGQIVKYGRNQYELKSEVLSQPKPTMDAVYRCLDEENLEQLADLLNRMDFNRLDDYQKRICNLYILLLDKAIPLPESLSSYAKTLKEEDVIDSTASEKSLERHFATIVLRCHKKMKHSKQCLVQLLKFPLPIEYLLSYTILKQITERYNQINDHIQELLNTDQLEELTDYITKQDDATWDYLKKVVEETIWMRKSNAILPSMDSKSNSFADLLTTRNYEHVLQMLQNKNSQSKNHINLTLAVEKLLETKQEILAHQTDSLAEKLHTRLQHQNIMTSHIFTEETETAPYLEDANPCQEKFEFGRKRNGSLNSEDLKPDRANYDLSGLQRIADTFAEGDKSLEEVCKDYGLSKDDTSVIKYIFARDCFYQNQTASGEYFLNLLRKEKNKSKEAQSLLSSLEREKKFLSSHEVDLNKCLTLRPQKKKPKK